MQHLHTVEIQIETSHECNIPLWMALIDFCKTFNTDEYWSIIRAPVRTRMDQRYINVIQVIQNIVISVLFSVWFHYGLS